ncbi:MAG: hypothetical protein RBU45_17620 [Myxococcota bacterium]|jgi:tetratricopeptide (TPR) repeat protein|nr:hypothetical protein [Myxococcota bacterium]
MDEGREPTRRDLERRIAEQERVVAAHPGDAAAHNALGAVLGMHAARLGQAQRHEEARGAFARALEAFARAISLAPTAADGWANQGAALANRAALQLALARQDPPPTVGATHPPAEVLLSQAASDLEGAVRSFRQACQLSPEDPTGWLALGRGLAGSGELKAWRGDPGGALLLLDEACGACARAASLQPDGPDAALAQATVELLRSRTLGALARPAEARQALRRTIAGLQPFVGQPDAGELCRHNLAVAWEDLATLLGSTPPTATGEGSHPAVEQTEAWFQALRLAPDGPRLEQARAAYDRLRPELERLGDPGGAGTALCELLGALDPACNDWATYNLAVHYWQQGHAPQALLVAQHLLEAPERRGPALALLAALLVELGQASAAVDLVGDVLEDHAGRFAVADGARAVLIGAAAAARLTDPERQRSMLDHSLRLLDRLPPAAAAESLLCDLIDTAAALLARLTLSGRGATPAAAGLPEAGAWLDRTQRIVQTRLGIWRAAGLLTDPADDPAAELGELDPDEAAATLEYNGRLSAARAACFFDLGR